MAAGGGGRRKRRLWLERGSRLRFAPHHEGVGGRLTAFCEIPHGRRALEFIHYLTAGSKLSPYEGRRWRAKSIPIRFVSPSLDLAALAPSMHKVVSSDNPRYALIR